jgi:hypothetical protein
MKCFKKRGLLFPASAKMVLLKKGKSIKHKVLKGITQRTQRPYNYQDEL